MTNKELLSEYVGKMIELQLIHEDNQNIYAFLDFDNKFIKLKTFDNVIALVNIDNILVIAETDEESKEKYKAYHNTWLENPYFKGDRKSDINFIKRIKK